MTIEHLAGMVKRGFDDVDRQFEGVHTEMKRGFDAVNQRFINLESDVAYLKARVMEISMQLHEHSEELAYISKRLDELTNSKNPKHAITLKELRMLEARVTALERKIIIQSK